MRVGRLLRLLPKSFGASGYLNRKGVLFLVGHMRAYTSLISHIIGSHPQVAGYAEMHQNYRNSLDFIELASKIERSGANAPAGRYLFDKILHPVTIAPGILRRADLSMLMVVRPPGATLSSIIRNRCAGLTTLHGAGDYYLARLKRLRSIMEQRQGRVLFVDAEAIVQTPDRALQEISAYLRITPTLEPNYRLFPLTGKAKHGDTSKWIGCGRIEPCRDDHVIEQISPPLEGLERAYREFREFALSTAECSVRCPSANAFSAGATSEQGSEPIPMDNGVRARRCA